MQSGSIVVILPFSHAIPEWVKPYINWLPEGNEKTTYQVRYVAEATDYRGKAVLFEEGVIGLHPEDGREFGLDVKYIREIQNPYEVDALEIVEEALLCHKTPAS